MYCITSLRFICRYRFIEDGALILVHGHSRCVLRLLRRARDAGRRFSVIVTEGRPDGSGITMAKELKALDLPVSIILDR
jgi:translation initiation factor eIF-2B subunit alpha